jgi:DNA-binding response OmpR family regulator
MPHLLVVDDDVYFIKIVRKILEYSGYMVSSASDAATALTKLEKSKNDRDGIDLILTDANMPGGSGFDLIKSIKNNPSTFEIPIAMLTSRRNKEDVLKGLKCGAIDYIVKPIDPDLFLEKIDSLLGMKSKKPAEIEYIEAPLQAQARWDIKSEIVAISEKGINLISLVPLPVESHFAVTSYLFGQIQIDRPHLKVLECSAAPDSLNAYLIKTAFVGLNDIEKQRIRFWVSKIILGQQEKKSA